MDKNSQNIKNVQDELSDMENRAKDTKAIMGTVGEMVLNKISESFEEEEDPITHKAWKKPKKLSSKYSSRSGDKRTLREEGDLFNSFSYKASKNSVRVGTNLEYAAIHNFGKKDKMPQRRFMPFDESESELKLEKELEDEIGEFILDSLLGELG